MSFYSILDVTPTSEDWIPNYLGPANTLVAQYGGKYLARTASHERLEGEGEAPQLKARTEGSVSNHYLIEAKDDLA